MKKNLLSIFALAVLMIVSAVGHAQTTYTRVNSFSDLEANAQYLLVGFDNDGNAYAMGYQKTNNRHAIPVNENGGTITATIATDASSQVDPFEFTLFIYDGNWVINDPLNNGYLYAPGGGNYLRTQSDITDNSKWTITDGDEGGMVPVAVAAVEQNIMRYNITSTLFGCYKSSSTVSATVYFYKAGAPIVNPEPSNYPTNFTAAVNGLDVTLNWTDATGEQLPSRYLIVGSTGNITVPTDGQPVADGYLTQNVNYGVQTYTFTGLTGGTTYHFAIFPYTNNGANIDYKTDGSYPVANATTESIELLLYEDFDYDLGRFYPYSVTGEQEWHQGAYQGTNYANMNGYASGAPHENEDWLITPELLFDRTFDAIVLEFRTAMKFDGNPLRVKVSCDYTGGAPSNGNWEDITDAFDFSTGDYEWVESGRVNIANYLTNQLGTFYVAFVYTSTDLAASSWEIDYVKVTGETGVSVSEQTVSTVSVYPNPANNVVSFNLKADAQVSIFDVTGRMVSTMNMAAGQGQYQVADLENGVYFLNVRYADGKKEVARFVKF